MEFDFFWLALAIAVAAYFIGDGLKNFKNPDAKGFSEIFDDDEYGLLTENEVHDFIGIAKEDAKYLRKEHPDIPHILINHKAYYPRVKLREWLKKLRG